MTGSELISHNVSMSQAFRFNAILNEWTSFERRFKWVQYVQTNHCHNYKYILLIILTSSLSLNLCSPFKICTQNLESGAYDVLDTAYEAYSENSERLLYGYPGTYELSTIYNCSHSYAIERQRITDISEAINSFPFPIWMMVMASLFTIWWMIGIHFRMNNVRSNSPSSSSSFSIISYLLLQPCMKEINWVSRLLAFLLAIYVFLIIICYFLNLMQSDKVTKYTPKVFDDVDDVLGENDVQIIIDAAVMASIESINYWNPDSQLKRIANHAVNVDGLVGSTSYIYAPLKSKHRIWLSHKHVLETVRSILCHPRYDVYMREICMYMSKSSKIHRITQPIYYASNMIHVKPVYKRYTKLVKRSFETGVNMYFRYHVAQIGATPVPNDCCSESIVTHDPEYAPYQLLNYKIAFLSLLIPVIFSLFSLILEYFKRPSTKTKRYPSRVSNRCKKSKLRL